MHRLIISILLAATVLISCNKDENPITNDGVNFYLTKNNLVDNYTTDYATINIDTIILCDEPFISYGNIAY
jgi:hypothetical protein